MQYQVNFIDGYDLKFKVFKTDANNEDELMKKFNAVFDADFEHTIISISTITSI